MEASIKNKYFLSAGDANAEGELSLTVLATKVIDIATEHANSLGIGNPSMTSLHAGWVLSRLTIHMEKYPKTNDNYIISTWIEDFNRHFSTRCFKIESESGETYGYVRSIWLVMDSVKRVNIGLGHLTLPEGMVRGEDVPIDRQQKHIPILPAELLSNDEKKSLRATHKPYEYRFKFCDLDSYRHVNTVRYIAMLLNQYTLEEHDKTMINRIELSFLHEASFGMETLLFRADDKDNDLSSAFQLCGKDDLSPLLFARVLRSERNKLKEG